MAPCTALLPAPADVEGLGALGLVTSLFAAVAYLTQRSQIGGLVTMAGLVIGVELVRWAVLSSKEMLTGSRR